MTESREHKRCKIRLSRLVGCPTEKYISRRRRPDVVCSNKNCFEVHCKRNNKNQMKCVIASSTGSAPVSCDDI